jgi:hypothetical protein
MLKTYANRKTPDTTQQEEKTPLFKWLQSQSLMTNLDGRK